MEKDWMKTNEWVKRKRKISQDQDQHVSKSFNLRRLVGEILTK